jgi:hypothetical protein
MMRGGAPLCSMTKGPLNFGSTDPMTPICLSTSAERLTRRRQGWSDRASSESILAIELGDLGDDQGAGAHRARAPWRFHSGRPAPWPGLLYDPAQPVGHAAIREARNAAMRLPIEVAARKRSLAAREMLIDQRKWSAKGDGPADGTTPPIKKRDFGTSRGSSRIAANP